MRDVVARIGRIPEAGRHYTENVADVNRVHRIGPDLLGELLDLGLPCRGSGEDRCFDRLDLANVGLELGLPSGHRLAMRWWSKALARVAAGGYTDAVIGFAGTCPKPGHADPCDFAFDTDGAAGVRSAPVETGTGSYAVGISLERGLRHFGEPYSTLFEQMRAVTFHLLPYHLEFDVDFLEDTGLADCRLAARFLFGLAQSVGLEARVAHGYLVTPPYATEHAWAEFRIDGTWWPADPLFLRSLAGWGIVDPAEWPPHRSPRGVLWRTGDRHPALLTHQGVERWARPTVVLVGADDVRGDRVEV